MFTKHGIFVELYHVVVDPALLRARIGAREMIRSPIDQVASRSPGITHNHYSQPTPPSPFILTNQTQSHPSNPKHKHKPPNVTMLAGFQSPENKDLSARRKADYKKALSQDDNRRKRGDNAIQIRKNKRQESLAKRRARCTSGAGGGGGALAALLGKSGAAGAGAGSNNGASSASQGAVGLSLHDLPKYVAGIVSTCAAHSNSNS